MRIELKSRRGSIGLEAAMMVPATIMMIYVARFVMEAMITQQETAVYMRSSTVNAAVSASSYSGLIGQIMIARGCKSDREPFNDQSQLSQAIKVSCSEQDAESGVPGRLKFWKRPEDGAAPWKKLLRDVKPSRQISDVRGVVIFSTMQFQRPDFLQRQGSGQSGHTYLVPKPKVWDHKKRPLKQASDKVIYQELRTENTHKLFPNVFPSWNK